MMQSALRARLLAAAPVTALVGTRIDWDKRPQANVLPAIVLEFVTEDRDQHMAGFQATRQPLVRVHCWASKAADAHNLAEYVTAALVPAATQSGVRFLRSFATLRSMPPEDTDNGLVHRQIVELRINHITIP